MPTNATTFNSRVTSEALEAKFRQVFPAQAGAELIQDLYASGVIQPVIDFSSVAEGSILPANLQTAWDFATGHQNTRNTTSTLITNTGFWLVRINATMYMDSTVTVGGKILIDDGVSTKVIWEARTVNDPTRTSGYSFTDEFVVFLRSGDSLKQVSNAVNVDLDTNWRQIADVNGNLVNPLGFTFS